MVKGRFVVQDISRKKGKNEGSEYYIIDLLCMGASVSVFSFEKPAFDVGVTYDFIFSLKESKIDKILSYEAV